MVGPLLIFTTRGDGHIHLHRGGCTYILIHPIRNTHVLDDWAPKRRYGKANIQVEVSGNDGNPTRSTGIFQGWIWEPIILRQQQQLPWTRLESWTSLEAKLTAGETVIAAISISLLLKESPQRQPFIVQHDNGFKIKVPKGLTDLLVKIIQHIQLFCGVSSWRISKLQDLFLPTVQFFSHSPLDFPTATGRFSLAG